MPPQRTTPPPQYDRPRGPGVAERAAQVRAHRNGHYRPRMATKEHRPALFRSYADLARVLGLWCLVLLLLGALAGLLVLGALWLGQHGLHWVAGLIGGRR